MSLWYCFVIAWVSFRCRFVIMLVSFWGGFGISVVAFSVHFRSMLGMFAEFCLTHVPKAHGAFMEAMIASQASPVAAPILLHSLCSLCISISTCSNG